MAGVLAVTVAVGLTFGIVILARFRRKSPQRHPITDEHDKDMGLMVQETGYKSETPRRLSEF